MSTKTMNATRKAMTSDELKFEIDYWLQKNSTIIFELHNILSNFGYQVPKDELTKFYFTRVAMKNFCKYPKNERKEVLHPENKDTGRKFSEMKIFEFDLGNDNMWNCYYAIADHLGKKCLSHPSYIELYDFVDKNFKIKKDYQLEKDDFYQAEVDAETDRVVKVNKVDKIGELESFAEKSESEGEE